METHNITNTDDERFTRSVSISRKTWDIAKTNKRKYNSRTISGYIEALILKDNIISVSPQEAQNAGI